MDDSDYNSSDEEFQQFSEKQYETLKEILPDADPSFLLKVCEKYYLRTPRLHRFIAKSLHKKNYPKKKDTERQQALEEQCLLYTTNFDVKTFLRDIPDPETHFTRTGRETVHTKEDFDHAFTFLKSHFCFLYARRVLTVLKEQKSIYKSARILQDLPSDLRSKRRTSICTIKSKNMALLQEMAFIRHRRQIVEYIEQQKNVKRAKFELAKELGQLIQCQCCFDAEVMLEDSTACDLGHLFCNTCMQRACEVAFGEGKLDFRCLQDCEAQFDWHSLEKALPVVLFTRIMQRKQAQEIQTAAIEDLEFCPFCDFASIPAQADKIFHCLNPDCLKETCRLCRKEAHIPLRCDEVESDQQVKLRKEIEDKLTEALVRNCYKCNLKFIKEDGCNKIVCSCGAMMCYLCKQPVKDYSHFNGIGGDKYDLCPLYTNTTKEDARRVLHEAKRISLEVNNNVLLIDPLVHTEQHYKKILKKMEKTPKEML